MGTSPWLELDEPDSALIVSIGTAISENENEYYRFEGVGQADWLGQVITSGPSRVGEYGVYQVLDGDPVVDAVPCCVAHARNGEQGTQLWNGSGDDSGDTSPGVCKAIITTDVRVAQTVETTSTVYENGWSDDDVWMIGGGARAVVNGPSYFCWHLPVRDNMPPRGALDFIPQPEDYGYPPFSEGTEIEWEYTYPELLSIEVADGDAVESADYPNLWSYNSPIGPIYPAADPDVGWKLGLPSAGEVDWEYDFGDLAWNAVPNTDGWDDHGWSEAYADDPSTADATVIAMPATSAENVDWGRFARPAFKYNLQARRFRFLNVPVTAPVIRQYPRDDGRGLSSAPRLYPPTKANRLAGGYM